ncbi:thiol reductant ABC exporter subunit CydD [Amycolatopsis sp. CA-230715]|uniref:thiol reductant ABC exporter subunit CydD n=1 Tax=Amycolatopsis sp. CA-230715 TaxID=2745196 RepID=UPI001C036DE2|nr:thiol reductant ABC exporter subunit CydD [Amycolatopsis sp. CA-230715]QWF78016.1 Vitamin B12 import ATP-binding protein BtuD [Amycolatopsis sp. CA-230715]
MRPLDPKLLRHAASARPFIAACAVLGAATAALVIVQAEFLATAITRAFLDGDGLTALAVPLTMLAAVVLGRATVAWLSETTAHHAAARVLSQLRESVVDAALRRGPRGSHRSPAELATLATRGVDKLDGYFARYLPQLLIAAIVPVTIGARILLADWVAAVIIGVTVPLIPVFMILIGLYTRRDVRRQWRTLSLLGNHFLDLVAGLTVLTAFGRAREQTRSLREITERYRAQTMRTLRVAFLSALALELLATLSVAVVAVSIGLRLLAGELDLHTALVVLILAPEVYLPLRAVGARFHDSAEGLAAAEDIVALTEDGRSGEPVPVPEGTALRLDGVTVDGRSGRVLDGLDLRVEPGEVVGIAGSSGAGKSTLLDLLLGWRRPDRGHATVDGAEIGDLDRAAWLARIAWVPQQPNLVAGTVADNVRLGAPDAPEEDLRRAAAAAALDLPLTTPVGELGAGLSTGQRRRVALARAILLDRPILLLDEPTEGIDAETEAVILDRLPGMLAGRTAIIVTHHSSVLARCDRVIRLPGPAADRPVPANAADAPEPAATAHALPAEPAGTRPAVQRSPWSPLLAAIRPHRTRLVLACLAATAALACGVALTATSSWLISSAALHPPVLSLMVAIVAVRAFGLAKGILRYVERLASHDVALRAMTELRVRVWEQLLRIGPATTARLRRGELLQRMVSDVDSQQDVLVRGLVPGVSVFLVLAATATGLGLLSPSAGIAAAIGFALAALVAPAVAAVASRHAERRTATRRGAVTTGIVELLHASAELIAFDAADSRHAVLREREAELVTDAKRSALSRGLGSGIGALGVGLASLACLMLGIAALRTGTLPGPALAVLALTPLATAELVAGLPEAAQRLIGSRESAVRLAELDAAPATAAEPAAPRRAAAAATLAADHLSVRWPGSTTDAVHDVDLVATRQLVLTGRSGAGKSTLVAAFMRYLDPARGRVLLDGSDAQLFSGDSVRAQLAWCDSDAHLFDSTLRENLRFAKPGSTDAELRDCLGRARLGRWLDSLPEGLDTALGTHGTPVSGGERQRLAVARVLLADRPMMIFDEPTAHLDAPTASALAADITASTANRAALIVTHRPGEFAGVPAIRIGTPAPETFPKETTTWPTTRHSPGSF